MEGLGLTDDRTWGAFHEHGPWNLELEHIPWLAEGPALRRTAREEVPALTEPARWPPGGRVVAVTARLSSAIVPWLWAKRRGHLADASVRTADLSRRLRLAAEALGPTYIKLGQIISAGEGLFPAELVAEFRLCRDQVRVESWPTVRRVVEDDLGRTIESVFAHFEQTPIAAASIAQVHAARLHTGEEVVVKVQRPQVAALVRKDLKVLAYIAPHLVGRIPVAALANPPALVELFADTIVEELDFRIEASNMIDITRMLHNLGQEGYVVPRPHPRLVTKRVLVMERLSGFNFDDVVGMKDAGIDTEAVIRTGMIAFMEGAMIEGVFHGDLHGGNLFVLPDGRTALLDFGIVGRLEGDRRLAFLKLMIGSTANDISAQLSALRDLGALPADTDLDAVIRDLGLDRPPVDPTTLTGEQLVAEIQRVVKALLGYGARMPKELMLYVKNLVFLDASIGRLAPDLDLLGEIAHISVHFAERHGHRFAEELGLTDKGWELDMDGVKAGFGLDPSVDKLTYRDLQERRQLIQRRMRERPAR